MILQSTDRIILPEDTEVPPLITLTRGSKLYGSRPVLNEISMIIRPGTATALIGRNGSGKSTLLSILAGLLRLSSGELTYGRHGLTTGYAPEAFPGLKLTAEDYLHHMGRLAGLSRAVTESRVSGLLDTFKLEAFRSRPMAGFSKGMLQKVNLIQSLLIRPQLLLLDEPMSGLDIPAQHILMELLQELKSEGTALVFSVHEVQTVEALADTVYVLQEGQVIRMIHGAENLRPAPAVHIIYTDLPPVEQESVKAWPGVLSMLPAPETAGTACTSLTVEQSVSDACLKQILAAGGSIVSVERLGESSGIAAWMDPKDQKGSGRG
ncbi:ATP-binding cassette domain-containing protein [Paenibacillus borealis]|uniref:ATP-binding cassette domain-containing protein n=1 Tax=Paenibacillus borealis TaxID=160799 RepID=UPI000694180C|nr:ABC transporter ATP-binding protein [Paenibacillus borealis]